MIDANVSRAVALWSNCTITDEFFREFFTFFPLIFSSNGV